MTTTTILTVPIARFAEMYSVEALEGRLAYGEFEDGAYVEVDGSEVKFDAAGMLILDVTINGRGRAPYRWVGPYEVPEDVGVVVTPGEYGFCMESAPYFVVEVHQWAQVEPVSYVLMNCGEEAARREFASICREYLWSSVAKWQVAETVRRQGDSTVIREAHLNDPARVTVVRLLVENQVRVLA